MTKKRKWRNKSIVFLVKRGFKQITLAKRFGLTKQRISKIIEVDTRTNKVATK